MKDIQQFLRRGNLGIEPYSAGPPMEDLQVELGSSNIIQMALNENLIGPSPKALAAIERDMSSAHPSDVDPRRAYLCSFQAMVENSEKPIVSTAESREGFSNQQNGGRVLNGDTGIREEWGI